ncbi:MAG TPA: HEAT repeat domain-containing protein [Anaeromyxobacter sp.]|nr:HEAT repeat domain-containing protein [Anaeromyxobacter sp.]
MRQIAAVLVAALFLAACGNPKDAEGWAKRAAGRSRLDEKLQALAEVRKAPGDRKLAVPALVAIVKDAGTHPRARAEAAVALGEIGDPAAVPALVAAVNPAASERDALELNRHVADALGALRAREAVPVLTQLTASPDGFTQVAAVDALGKIGDPAAVDTLVAVATGERVEPFTAKKALLALGRIGDQKAGPAVMRMLFEERPGVSFFPEAAFAVVQIGSPMGPPLLAVLEGRDVKLATWARERGVVQGALYAKSAQLLGDVGGAEAVPALVKKLSYQDPDPGIGTYVRVFAAESLGRMRAREAARTLADLAAREKDPDVRDRYCDALARIGDPAAIPALRSAAAAAPDWNLREGPLVALSRLGGEAERRVVDDARARQCAKGCPPAVEAAFEGMRARLDAAKACAAVGCWQGKLADASAAVRDRAALEVGRAGGAAQAGPLGDAIVLPVSTEGDLAARYHAVLGLGWIGAREKLGEAGEGIASRIDAMIAQDRGRTLTAGVNEDALRLATKLRRAGAVAAR